MRTILTILLVFVIAGCRGQSQYVFDTAKVTYEFKQETNKWDYYKLNGTLLYKDILKVKKQDYEDHPNLEQRMNTFLLECL